MNEKRKPRPVQPTGNAAQFGTSLESVLSKLTNVKRNGKGYIASCPVPTHGKKRGDHNPSLSIAKGENGGIVFDCKAGCRKEDILAKLNLSWADVMPPASELPAIQKSKSRPAKPPPPSFSTAKAAIASVEAKLGPVSGTWEYADAAGQLVGMVARWDTPKGKEIRPFRKTSRGWEVAGMTAPRPLYRLTETAEAERVYVTEGEKAADAIRALGLNATTSAGGCKAARQTDWAPLGGKECVALPDNDASGEDYLADVLDFLGALNDQPTAKVVRLPGLPPAGDAVEFIAARRAAGASDTEIRNEIEQLAAEASPAGPSRRQELAWHRFPVEVLPDPLREFIQAGAKSMHCDPAMIALPALTACAGAIGTTRRVQIKTTWFEPAIIWSAVVSPSGTMKSPAHEFAVAALQKAQEARFREHQQQMEQYEEDLMRYEADLKAWQQQKSRDPGDRPKKPQPPACVRYLVQDVTIEGLAPILLVNGRGVLLARDELAGWFTGFNQYKKGGGSDVANWLQLHRAGLLIVDRKTGVPRTIYVPGAAVSVCGTIQPRTLQNVLTRDFFEAGLPARLLLAAPPVRLKQWKDDEADPRIIARFETLIVHLLGLNHSISEDEEPVPINIVLSGGARRLFIAWYNENAELIEAADNDDMRAVLAKIESYAVRLALVIHCIKWVASGDSPDRPIDEESMTAGLTLARWFANEAERLYGLWNESEADRDLRILAAKARSLAAKGDGTVSVRDWQRARSLRKSEPAQAELQRLIEANYGYWMPSHQSGPGKPGGPRYKPNDDTDNDNNRPPDAKNGNIVSVRNVSDSAAAPPEPQQSEDPAGDSDRRETEARRHVKQQADLGLPIEPDPKAGQAWALEA